MSTDAIAVLLDKSIAADFAFFFVLTFVGSMASFLHKISSLSEFSLFRVVSHLFASLNASVLTLLLCLHYELGPSLSGFLVVLGAYSGGHATEMLLERVEKKFLLNLNFIQDLHEQKTNSTR